MVVRWLIALAFGLTVLGAPHPLVADQAGPAPATDVFDPATALAFSQAAIGRQVGDYEFFDQGRRAVRLTDYRGRPLIVSLIFTACTHSCPLITQHLADAVEAAQSAFGADNFQTITIGFDPDKDTPERLHDYVQAQGIDLPNWHFLSGDAATIDALIEDLGFIRVASPRGFDHLAQISIIDSTGKVYHQVYGDTFNVTAVVDPLKAVMSHETAGAFDLSDIVQRVRLFCTYYDPGRGRYAFDYSLFISIAVGAATLIGLAVILIGYWVRSRKSPLGPA